jgi:O-antigen/teichoic acid export membrane protein
MSTAKKILGNTAVQVAGRGMMAAASVVILKIISGFLSVEGYGMYTGVWEFLAFFGIAADLGLFTIAVREMGKGTRERDFVVGNILGMRIVLAICAMTVAIGAAFLVPRYDGTYIPIGVAIASMAVFLSILHGTVSSVLQVELKMQYATLGLVGGKVLGLGWMIAVIFYFFAGEPGANAFYNLIFAGVIGNIFAFAFTFRYALKYARIRPLFCREYWREIFVTSVPYGLALILNMVYFRIDSLMILFMKGPTELGYYGPAMRILEILSVIPVYFMNSVLPVLSRVVQEGEARASEAAVAGGRAVRHGGEKLVRILRLSFDFLFMAGFPIVVGLMVLAYPIIFIITQPEFLSRLDEGIYGSDIALQILVFAVFFAFLNSLFTYSLVAVNKQNHLLWINGSAAVLNIVVNFIAIPIWGFRGAAAASVLTEAYILVLAWLVARRWLTYKLDFWSFGKTAVAAVLMGVVVWYLKEPTYYLWGLQNWNVFILTPLGAVVYGGLLLLFGAMPEEFMREVRRRI